MASIHPHIDALKERVRAFKSKFKSDSTSGSGPIGTQDTPVVVDANSSGPTPAVQRAADVPQLHEDAKKTMVTNVNIPEWKLTLNEYCETTLPLLVDFNAQFIVAKFVFDPERLGQALKYVIGHVIDYEDRDRNGCNDFDPAEKTAMLNDLVIQICRGQIPCDLGFPSEVPTQKRFKYHALFSLVYFLSSNSNASPDFKTMTLLLYEELLGPENDIGMFTATEDDKPNLARALFWDHARAQAKLWSEIPMLFATSEHWADERHQPLMLKLMALACSC
jgi:hypothetical protein